MTSRVDEDELRRLGESERPPLPTTEGADPLIGTIVGDRYRVVSVLDAGAQATVYLARHTLIKRPVALKVLHSLRTPDRKLVRQFLDEGQVAGTMGHPNIVESLDMGATKDGRPYLVLEYLDGTTLANELARGTLDCERVVHIASQIAAALAAAHMRGIVHRDLKPANVFLIARDGREDHVKVIDFGVSKFLARADADGGLVVGTPHYMAPEQVTTPSSVDARSDIYALGAILYEMLSSTLPFSGAYENVEELLAAIATSTPPTLASRRPDLPGDLVAIVDRALERKPAARYQHMADLQAALEPFVPAFPPRASAERLRPSSSLAGVETTPDMVLAQDVAPRKPRLGAAVLAIVVAAAALAPHEPPRERSAATAETSQTIPADVVSATVQANSASVTACFERARMLNPELRGRVTVRATIDLDGRATSPFVETTTARDTRLESCILGELARWTFRAPTRAAPANLTYTFVFGED